MLHSLIQQYSTPSFTWFHSIIWINYFLKLHINIFNWNIMLAYYSIQFDYLKKFPKNAISNITKILLCPSDKEDAPEKLTLWAWSLPKRETNEIISKGVWNRKDIKNSLTQLFVNSMCLKQYLEQLYNKSKARDNIFHNLFNNMLRWKIVIAAMSLSKEPTIDTTSMQQS